jgi:hypothetical protein
MTGRKPYAVRVRSTGETVRTFATFNGALNYAHKLEREHDEARARLEYLRGEIHAERISYGEIAELQGLVPHIDPHDFELLEWAGVTEEEAMARAYGPPAGGTS